MKQRWMRFTGLVLVLIMTAVLAAGCGLSGSGGTKTEDGNKTLFTYDGTKVSLKETWIYARMLGEQYEAQYSSYFGTDFWGMEISTDEDGNAVTFEEMVKEQAVTQIKQIIVLNNKAKEMKCSLTEDEKKECAEFAEAFAKDEKGNTILRECGAKQEDMEKIYEDNKLASKVQEAMVKDVDRKVSDDDARQTTIYRVVYPTSKTDENGETVELSQKEKDKAKKDAEAALKAVSSGKKTIEKAAEEAGWTNTDETFAKGESEEGKAFEKDLKKAKDGDMLDKVYSCDQGYVIAKLVAYTDKEATESNKESIIAGREQELFNKTYKKWTDKLEEKWDFKKDVDQELLAQLVLRSAESTATEDAGAETAPAEAATGE